MNVFITGASTGIGLACAKWFAERNDKVFACARKKEDLERLGSIENIIPIKLDVTNPIQIEESVKKIEKMDEKIDILINNAGIAILGPLMELTKEDIQKQFDINVIGVFRITKAFFPLLLESKGRIINIGSTAGLHAYPFVGPYAMSKHAIEAFSDSLRREFLDLGIKVILIEPSKVVTPIWQKVEGLSGILENSLFKEKAEKLLIKSLADSDKKGLPVEAVAKVVYKVAHMKKPKTRYLISKHKMLSRLTNALPDAWLDGIIKKM